MWPIAMGWHLQFSFMCLFLKNYSLSQSLLNLICIMFTVTETYFMDFTTLGPRDLLFWFSSHSPHTFGDVTITDDGPQILTYARHSRTLSNEGSLACQTYCDTGHPFIMVITEGPWYSNKLQSAWQWSCHYLFLRPRSVDVATRDRTQVFCMRGERSTTEPPRMHYFLFQVAHGNFFINLSTEH